MSEAVFDPVAALRVLTEEQVEFVVIGGLAGRMWGSPTITNDLDICYDRQRPNLPKLVAALRRLDAHLRGAPENLPFLLDERTLAFGDSFTFNTTAGKLDCLGTPSGTRGYADLAQTAATFEIDGMAVRFASIDDVMRMKKAAGRPKDRIEYEILAAVKRERKQP
jgi:hypothetical protein